MERLLLGARHLTSGGAPACGPAVADESRSPNCMAMVALLTRLGAGWRHHQPPVRRTRRAYVDVFPRGSIPPS